MLDPSWHPANRCVIVKPSCSWTSGLVYAEVAALDVVYQAAAQLPGDGAIVVAGAPCQLRRVIDLARFPDPRVIID